MKIFLIILMLFIAACGPSQSQIIKEAYDKGQITTSEYLALMNQLEAQKKENAAIMGAALLGYSANIQQQAQQDYYNRAAIANQLNQNAIQQQQLMEMQKLNNNLMWRGR